MKKFIFMLTYYVGLLETLILPAYKVHHYHGAVLDKTLELGVPIVFLSGSLAVVWSTVCLTIGLKVLGTKEKNKGTKAQGGKS